jgi:hypothetical protein
VLKIDEEGFNTTQDQVKRINRAREMTVQSLGLPLWRALMAWSIVRSQIGSRMLCKFLKLEVFEAIPPVFAVIPPTAELLGGS